jgi:hypothetical protein
MLSQSQAQVLLDQVKVLPVQDTQLALGETSASFISGSKDGTYQAQPLIK